MVNKDDTINLELRVNTDDKDFLAEASGSDPGGFTREIEILAVAAAPDGAPPRVEVGDCTSISSRPTR